MRFFSPCEEMIKDAESLPECNVKLFMRHSIRFDNPINGDYTQLLLTPEGIELARKMGSAIDRPLGECAASPVKRCVQTVKFIAEGMNGNYDSGWKTRKVHEYKAFGTLLGDPGPEESGGVGWNKYFHYLQTGNIEGSRGITLEMEATPVLDGIFSFNGSPGTLDIICSHDSHVVILASALFNLRTGLDGHSWCRYTEGLFLYGTRDDFTAVWRGQTKHFHNYLC